MKLRLAVSFNGALDGVWRGGLWPTKLGTSAVTYKTLVGGFRHGIYFPNICNIPSHLLSYFSRWFKPPIRNMLVTLLGTFYLNFPLRNLNKIRGCNQVSTCDSWRPSIQHLSISFHSAADVETRWGRRCDHVGMMTHREEIRNIPKFIFYSWCILINT